MLDHVEQQHAVEIPIRKGQRFRVRPGDRIGVQRVPAAVLAGDRNGCRSVVHPAGARAQPRAVAQNLAAPAAHIQDTHARADFRQRERSLQPARKALAVRFIEFVEALASRAEIFLGVKVGREGGMFCGRRCHHR